MAAPFEVIDVDGREVKITNPDKVFFPETGATKMDLVHYYLAVKNEALTGCRDRPSTMYRWPNGVSAPDDAFYQKRVPQHRPEWLETALISFPSGRTANMLAIADAAHIVWALNLGCIDLNPWPVRRDDVDHPDELRVDLDPTPGIPYSDVCRTAPVVRGARGTRFSRVAEDLGKARHACVCSDRAALELHSGETSGTRAGTRGRAPYGRACNDRVVEGGAPRRLRRLQPECTRPHHRIRVFGPPVADAGVSTPVTWDEAGDVDLDPRDFRMDTVPKRVEEIGDPGAGIDVAVGNIEPLLELADRDEKEGAGEAPLPPHFPKGEREPPRVQPSRKRR